MFEQDFTVHVLLLMATSASGLRRICYSSPQQFYLHCFNTIVDKFCYPGDMLSVDGGADAAVEARIRIRELVPLLTDRDISLIRRGRLYSS